MQNPNDPNGDKCPGCYRMVWVYDYLCPVCRTYYEEPNPSVEERNRLMKLKEENQLHEQLEESKPEFVEGCKKCYSTEIEKVTGEHKENWVTVRCLNPDCKTHFHYWHTQLEMNLEKDWKIKPPMQEEIK